MSPSASQPNGVAGDKPDPARIPAGEIRAQVERILASPAFGVPERAKRFLAHVVEETLAGRASRIKAYSIAIEVFGRDASFDARSDPIVGIEAGRIRRALEHYYLTAGRTDPILITIPKGGYVPAFAAREPEGIGSTGPVPQPAITATPSTVSVIGFNRGLVIAGLLAIVVALLAIAFRESLERLVFQRATEPRSPAEPSVATLLVEPFDDLTGTQTGAIVARGLTEEVVGQLAKFRELAVLVSDPRRPWAATADRLASTRVRYALTGSLRVEGETIRLAARVVNRDDGSVLWVDSYDGDFKVGRLLEIERAIAQEVATALAQPYGVIFRADTARARENPPDDWEAYACTLAYYSYRIELNPTVHTSVRSCLERSVERFPSYATGWALLSLTYLDELRFQYRIKALSPPPLDRAFQAARRAVELDPANVRGLQAEMLALFFKGDVSAALKVGQHALALNPNDTELLGEFGFRLALSGEWERGCPMVAQALERNPGPLGYYETALSLCFYMQSDYETAAGWVEKAGIQENPIYHFIAAAIYGQLGNEDSVARQREWIWANAPGLLAIINDVIAERIKSPKDQAHFREGLKKAGIAIPLP